MKSRQEFIERWIDEFSGLILASFRQAERLDAAESGRFMRLQIRKAAEFLGKQYDDLNPPPKAPANGQPAQKQAVKPP